MALKQKSEHSVHVRLDSPVDKRKVVLQTAIDAVALLKNYENIHRIRHEKAVTLGEFQRVVVQVHRLVKQVEFGELPMDMEDLKHVHAPSGKKVFAPVVKQMKKKMVTQKEEHHSSLDAQLESLRRKLDSL